MLKLKIDGLSCSIKSKEILKDITVSFQQGEMAAVLGRNGAGKTTFIRCIADLILIKAALFWKRTARSSIALQLRIYRARKDNLFADDL